MGTVRVLRRLPQEFPMPNATPQPSAPEPSANPTPPALDRPPSDPGAANPKSAEEGVLFRALVDAGVEAKAAYTVEKRMHAMTSNTAAAHTQPILVEVRGVAGEVRALAKADAERAGEVRGLAGEVRALAGEVRALAKADTERAEEVRGLAGEVRGLAGEVRGLAEDVRALAVKVRELAGEVRELAVDVRALAEAGADRDRRLDVIDARLDGLKLLGQIMVGAYALLITVLIAVFGLLFTR